jgi:hypothetical protein
LIHGTQLSKRVYDRATPLRRSFVARETETEPLPPLAALVDSGRASSVRLRLFLGILCIASAGTDPHATIAPARDWALLLGLHDPEDAGQRRVRAAIKFLEGQSLIARSERSGTSPEIVLLREDGSGRPYTSPLEYIDVKSEAKLSVEHQFVSIPAGFWKSGWLATLSNNAIASWLVLMHSTRSGTAQEEWLSPNQVRGLYGISEDTWYRGVGELRRLGALRVDKRSIEKAFNPHRVRNYYTLKLKRLERLPNWASDD